MTSRAEEKEMMSPYRRAVAEVVDAQWFNRTEGLALLTLWVVKLTRAWSAEEQATEYVKAVQELQEVSPEVFDPTHPAFNC